MTKIFSNITFLRIASFITTSTIKFDIYHNLGKTRILMKEFRIKGQQRNKIQYFTNIASLNNKQQKSIKIIQKGMLSHQHGTNKWV